MRTPRTTRSKVGKQRRETLHFVQDAAFLCKTQVILPICTTPFRQALNPTSSVLKIENGDTPVGLEKAVEFLKDCVHGSDCDRPFFVQVACFSRSWTP